MFERDENTAKLTFQWVVGDTRALEKNLIQLSRSKHQYMITVFSRLVAFGLTFLVAFALLPEVDLGVVFLITLAGSYSLWVSWGVAIFSLRALEHMLAEDNRKVGWNHVWLDSTGVTWNTETSQEYTSWLGVSEIIEHEGSLWMKTGPAHGYYLPPRVFASRDELTECSKLIARFRAQPTQPRHLSGTDDSLVKH